MGAALQFVISFESAGPCVSCGVHVILPADFRQQKLKDQTNFYCPNGHVQHYTGETEIDRLKREVAAKDQSLAWEKQRREREERSHVATRGQLTKAKNQLGRVACGVCPLCKRNFPALRDHMKTKHPEYRFDTGVPLLPAKGETS